MKQQCLICGRVLRNNKSLGSHIRMVHNIPIRMYKEKYNLIHKCKKCKRELSKNCKGDYCNHCRDRTGEKNPFFNKTHSAETKRILSEKNKETSKKLWENPEYRDKVIREMSKPRSEKFKQEQSVRIKNWYEENPLQRELRSNSMKKSWEDGRIVSNNFSCNKSKIECDFFGEVSKIVSNAQKDKTIKNAKKSWFFPDILFEKDGIIIEFYGNFWHANPLMYKENDILHNNLIAKDIWEKDEKRIKSLSDMGYKVLVVFEKEYKEDKQLVLKRIEQMLNWESCLL